MEGKNISQKTRETILALRGKDKVRVLFVCLGNICRSPAAEGVMRAVVDANDAAGWCEIDSAGTGSYHIGDLPDMRMRRAAARRGYNLTHHARQLRRSDFDDFDLIIGMDSTNISNIKRLAATEADEAKVVPMAMWLDPASGYDHVPDPYYEGAEGFELVLDQLEYACRHLFADLNNGRG